jgi:hypothetical protein
MLDRVFVDCCSRLRQHRQKLQQAVEKALADLAKSAVPMEMKRKLQPSQDGTETLSVRLLMHACLGFDREKLEHFVVL